MNVNMSGYLSTGFMSAVMSCMERSRESLCSDIEADGAVAVAVALF